MTKFQNFSKIMIMTTAYPSLWDSVKVVIGEYVILLNNYINKKQKKKKIHSTLKVRKVKRNQKQKDMYKIILP